MGGLLWLGLIIAALAVSAGVYLAVMDARNCPQSPRLIRRRRHTVSTQVRAHCGTWPCKLGNARRSGATDCIAPTDLSLPRWSYFTPSVVYNAPLIDEHSNVYVIATSGEVFALDPNGEVRWLYKTRLPDPANPAMQDDTLFTLDTGGFGYALSTQTGQERWVRKVADRAGGGNDAVAVGEGLVIFHQHIGAAGWTDEAEFIACEVDTGREVWRSRVDSNYFNVMPAFAENGSAIVFTDQNGGTFKLESRTGRVLWAQPGFPFPLTPEEHWYGAVGEAPRSHSALALVGDGVIYTAGNPTRSRGRVRALSLASGEELWSRKFELMMGNGGALADIDGVPTLVFGVGIPALHPIPEANPPYHGKVYALDASTGATLWSFRAAPLADWKAAGSVMYSRCFQMNMPDAFSAPTIDGNGTVYIGWQSGIVYAINGRNGKLVSFYETNEGIQAAPSIGPRGELIVAGGRHTHSFWPEQ